MEQQESQLLSGGEPFEHTVMIWIPSVTKDKKPLPPAVVDSWTTRFINLMTALFGGATAYGIRSPVLCQALAEATGLPVEIVYSPMATLAGGDLPDERRPPFEQKLASLKAKVLEKSLFTDEDLVSLEDPAIIREPVCVVQSYATASGFTEENLKMLEILLLQMGKDTDQIEMGIFEDGTFRRLQV